MPFHTTLVLKMIILARQARDKHSLGKALKKEVRLRFLVDPEEVILGLQYNVCIDEFSLLNGAEKTPFWGGGGGGFYVKTIFFPRKPGAEHRKVEVKKRGVC